MTRARSRSAPPPTRADRVAVARLKAAGYSVKEIYIRAHVYPIAVIRILNHLDQKALQAMAQQTKQKGKLMFLKAMNDGLKVFAVDRLDSGAGASPRGRLRG